MRKVAIFIPLLIFGIFFGASRGVKQTFPVAPEAPSGPEVVEASGHRPLRSPSAQGRRMLGTYPSSAFRKLGIASLLLGVPGELIETLALTEIPESRTSLAVAFQFTVNGIALESSDLYFSIHPDRLQFETGAFPAMQNYNVPGFPETFDEVSARKNITNVVRGLDPMVSGVQLTPRPPTYALDRKSGGMLPCANYEVTYATPWGPQLDAVCVNAQSGAVVRRQSKLKSF